MTVLYTNNAATTLAATISNSATSMSVANNTGQLFPATNTGFFFLTLIDSGGSLEIVKVTSRIFDSMTIERAQDGTTALAFTAGSKVELRITKGMLDQLKIDTVRGNVAAANLNDWDAFQLLYDGGINIGDSSSVNNQDVAIAIGVKAEVSTNGYMGIAIGGGSSANQLYSVALGGMAKAHGYSSLAIGYGAQVSPISGTGSSAIAIGLNASVLGASSSAIVIGTNSDASSSIPSGVGIGNYVHVNDEGALVLNGTSSTLYSGGSGFFVRPIRDNSYGQTATGTLQYDTYTNEVFYGEGSVLAGVTNGLTDDPSVAYKTVLGSGAVGRIRAAAIGYAADARNNAVAVGSNAFATNNGVAAGWLSSAGNSGVAIGYGATSGFFSIAIGTAAVASANASIVLSADALNGALTAETEGFFVKPIRNDSTFQTSGGSLQYDKTTGEIFYQATTQADVFQLTSKSTAVTSNGTSGQITTHNAALAANTAVWFQVFNDKVTAKDTILVNLTSGVSVYDVRAGSVQAGSFYIYLKNTSAGSLSEAMTINYTVHKG